MRLWCPIRLCRFRLTANYRKFFLSKMCRSENRSETKRLGQLGKGVMDQQRSNDNRDREHRCCLSFWTLDGDVTGDDDHID